MSSSLLDEGDKADLSIQPITTNTIYVNSINWTLSLLTGVIHETVYYHFDLSFRHINLPGPFVRQRVSEIFK